MLAATVSLSRGLPTCTESPLGMVASTEPSSRTNRTLATVFSSAAGCSVGLVSWAHQGRPARQQARNKIARNPLEQRSFRRISSQTKGSTGALPLRTPNPSLNGEKGPSQRATFALQLERICRLLEQDPELTWIDRE